MTHTVGGALRGKVAVVTGASQGIGLAIATRFAAEGARVYVTGRREAELARAVATIGEHARSVVADSASLDDLRRLFAQVAAADDRIDVLVANAGGGTVGRLETITEADFDLTFGLNVKGVVFTVKGALPLLSEGASVILVGSSGSARALPSQSLYGASKAALRSFARSWMLELKRRHIRVNVLSPGPVETPSLMSLSGAGEEQEFLARLARTIPAGRVGQPGEIAEVALFLASAAASYVNGCELFADGGHAQV